MVTSFDHNGHHQAISQKLRKAGTLESKIVNLYGNPFTLILIYY